MIELRPHHVGNLFHIYTKPYLPKGNFEQNLDKWGENLYFQRYPIDTINQVITLFSNIFNGTEEIKIIAGPDAICQSRCLKGIERELKEYKSMKLTLEIKRNISIRETRLQICCYNNDFELDLFWQETLNLKLGQCYGWPELEKKFRYLRRKLKKNYETDLITDALEQWKQKRNSN